MKKLRITSRQLGWAMILLGSFGLLAGGALWLRPDSSHKPPAAGVDTPAAPVATPPSAHAITTYTVAPDAPKYIEIPAIAVKQTRVIQLGLQSNQEIAVPKNIHDAGWYEQSAKPGQQGAMFIYGHVSSWEAKGLFYNLKKLHTGDKISVTRGDNTILTYQVKDIKTYPVEAVDMNAVLKPIDAHKPGLNLMTCAGSVIKGTNNFSKRLVVFTSQI